MAKYLLLYEGGSMPETDAERDAVMKAWDSWFHTLGGALADGGNPFTPASKKISADGSIKDGAGPGTGYRLQGERWEELKKLRHVTSASNPETEVS